GISIAGSSSRVPATSGRAGVALGGLHEVAEEEGDRGGPDATHPGRDPAGDLLAGLVDVGEQLAALVLHAGADDHATGLDVLGLDHARHAGGGDQDVG